MRYALGASRSRIVSQLFVEGGILGLPEPCRPAIASAGRQRARPSHDPRRPRQRTLLRQHRRSRPSLHPWHLRLRQPALQPRARPALHPSRSRRSSPPKSAGTASKTSQRFRKSAVGVQIALSVLLLGAAGLFVRTLDNLRNQPVGFNTTRLLTFNVDPTSSGYGEDRISQIVTNVLASVSRIPGVPLPPRPPPTLSSPATAPLSGFSIENHKFAEDENHSFEAPWITSGYFATLAQPLLAGREFTAADANATAKVAVVNLAFAKKYFSSPQNALGHLVTANDEHNAKPTPPSSAS